MHHPRKITPDTPMRWLAWLLEDDTKRQHGYAKCRKITDKCVGDLHICGALACLAVADILNDGYDVATIAMIRGRADHDVEHPILKRLVDDGFMTMGRISGNKLTFALTWEGLARAESVRSGLDGMMERIGVRVVLNQSRDKDRPAAALRVQDRRTAGRVNARAVTPEEKGNANE